MMYHSGISCRGNAESRPLVVIARSEATTQSMARQVAIWIASLRSQ